MSEKQNGNSKELVLSWEEVPEFKTLEDERNFWNNHELDPLLLHQSMVRATGQDFATLSIKLDPRLMSRLKRLAKRRYSDMPTMIRQWIVERLEREQGETQTTSPGPV